MKDKFVLLNLSGPNLNHSSLPFADEIHEFHYVFEQKTIKK